MRRRADDACPGEFVYPAGFSGTCPKRSFAHERLHVRECSPDKAPAKSGVVSQMDRPVPDCAEFLGHAEGVTRGPIRATMAGNKKVTGGSPCLRCPANKAPAIGTQ